MSDPVKLIEAINASVEKIKSANEQVNAELKKAIEANGAVTTETAVKLEKVVADISGNSQRIIDLEQKLADKVIQGKAAPKTLGDSVIETEAFKQFAMGNTQKFRIEANTITGQSGSPAENSDTLVQSQRRAGIIPGAFRNLRVADVVPTVPVTSNIYEYTRELLFTNNAAERSEGVAKPESVLTFELAQAPIRTVPHFLKASKQILEDAPALAAYIDTRLRYGVDLRFEQQIVNGNGTNPNISGMTDSGNYTAFTAVSGENQLDSLNRMQAQLATADYEITAYLMNPADWHAIERLKVGSSDDRYVVGNPLGTIGRILWGQPVILSNSITAGNAIAANFPIAYAILERSATVVEMFEQDDDNVQKNLITIRAEKRGALASYRPASSVHGALVTA